MRVLLTGSTGYIGRRLLPELIRSGHEVICLVRDRRRFDWQDFTEDDLRHIRVVEGDLNMRVTALVYHHCERPGFKRSFAVAAAG